VSATTTARSPFTAGTRSGATLDVALAAVALAGTLAQFSRVDLGPLRPGSGLYHSRTAYLDPAGVLLAACSTLPVAAWRRFPLGVLAVTGGASVLLAGLGYPLDLTLGPAAALYLLAAGRDPQSPWTTRTTVTVLGLFVAYLGATAAAHGSFPASALLHSGLVWAVAWFAGERTRLRRVHMAELTERAARSERDAERERLLAAANERARIARDLHDSAGHAISVIAVRAGAARLRHDDDPGRSRVALEEIEQLARQTAAEIDHIVGSLRDSGAQSGVIEAPPGLASLDTLIAQHTATGLGVATEMSGAPRTLGDAADQAAYRILQEALTNAARHGSGTARIELAYDDTAIELTVTNPVAAVNGAARPGGGHGLVGMRERATLLGGDLDVAHIDGAFEVHARIPYGGRRR
jgi:signal transduction histidine kinase